MFGLSYPVVDDGSSYSGPWEQFGQGYIPHTVVIGHDMRVVYTAVGANDSAIRSAIESALHAMQTEVSTQHEESIPDGWNLSVAYPNPFNPSTTLKYTLAKATKVSINIYNVAGERVATLVNEQKWPGSYTVSWNGKAENGNVVSNGIYFIKLTTPEYEKTQQVMFLK